jgi:hypothetical protein
MRIPFTNIKVTTKEQIGSGLAAVGGWMAFSAAFSTAPIWATLISIPAVVGVGVGAVKAAQAAYKFAYEKAEDYAHKHPQGKVSKFMEYAPTFGPDEQDDHEMDLGEGENLTAAERNGLRTDFAATDAISYTQRTLLNLREKAVQYTLAPLNRAEIDAIPERTLRNGKGF